MKEGKMLKQKYDESIDRLRGVLDFPWATPEFYAAWLTQSYFYSQRVTRILLLASAYSPIAATKLHRRLHTHAGEEKGHELLAERDVKDLGFDVKEIGEFPVTRGFYSAQFFTIQHVSSESLFGWILPLEGLAIHYGKDLLALVKKSPTTPSRFLDVHVNEDPGHVDSAFDTVEAFSADKHAQIVSNMEFTVDMYFQILQKCRSYADKGIRRKAS
jgi:hypothetical protein